MSTTWPAGEVLGPDLEAPEDPRSWGGRAREFAREVVGPIGAVLDGMGAADIAAAGSPVRDLLAQAQLEGFTRLGAPRRLGGIPASPFDQVRVLEELATADAALAGLLAVAPTPFRWAATLGTASLSRDVAAPYLSARRTDWIGCCAIAGPARVVARPDGRHWTLAGETVAVPGGALATHALVACTVDGAGSALAVAPLDAPGAGRAPADDVAGLRAMCRARIVLDGVRVPADHVMLGGDGPPPGVSGAYAHAAGALVALGLARAAYEGTARWAREAFWSGELRSAGAVLPALHDLHRGLDAARSLARATYVPDPAPRLGRDEEDELARQARAARLFATEVALDAAQTAVRLCGARPDVAFLDGSAFSPARLVRDALAATHPPQEAHDGTGQDP